MPPRYGRLTGFDARKLAAASVDPAKDPWGKYEAWRSSPVFSRWNRFGRAFPGLGIATVAFAVYLGVEYMFFPEQKHHGGPTQLDAHGPSVAQSG